MRGHVSLLLLLLPAIALADEPNRLRWQRAIEVPEIEATSLVAVPLDVHFFQHTRPGWPDVRLWNSLGAPQGFVIRKVSESKSHAVRGFWAAEQGAVKVDGDRELIVEFTLRDKEPSPQGIRLVTPLRDFERQVQVESSADGVQWTAVGKSTLIFDYTRYINARNDLVPLTANADRRFRLIVNNLTEEQEGQLLELHRRLKGDEETDRTENTVVARRPFRIDRIEFYHDERTIETGRPELTTYEVTDFAVKEDEKRHETTVTIPAQRQPITQIKILSDSENFSRAARVEIARESSDGGTSRQRFAPGTLTRFSVGDVQKDDTVLAIAETSTDQFQVIISNRDSAPLNITGVELSGPKYELLALASPDQPLHLDYGSDTVAAGRFDTAALEAALAKRGPSVSGTLQPPRDNPDAPVPTGRIWQPWNDLRILVGTIIALAALLGWGLYRASVQITPPPGN